MTGRKITVVGENELGLSERDRDQRRDEADDQEDSESQDAALTSLGRHVPTLP